MTNPVFNPADWPGAIVYRPEVDSALEYWVDKDQVVDTRTGDRFYMKTPHGDGMAQYKLMGSNFEAIVMGGYYKHLSLDDDGSWRSVYEIKLTTRWAGSPDHAPDDLSRLASFIRAYSDARSKGARVECLVVDTRRTGRS